MKIIKITILIVVLAMVGATFTADAKVKKRRGRSKAKKERVMQQKQQQKSPEAQPQCPLDKVEYRYSYMRMTPWETMRLERKNGKVVMAIKGTTTEEQEFVLDDGEQLMREALTIIEEEKMLDYGVSYEPKIQPLDGYAWRFSAQLSDGRKVSSRGRNAEPEGKGLGRMGTLLREMAIKLLGIEY